MKMKAFALDCERGAFCEQSLICKVPGQLTQSAQAHHDEAHKSSIESNVCGLHLGKCHAMPF